MSPARLKIEEYVSAAHLLLESFMRDREELANHYADFTSDYLVSFACQISKVKHLEAALRLDEQQRKVTNVLFLEADHLCAELNYLSVIMKRANLDTALLTKVKTDINKRSIESAVAKLQKFLVYLTEHHWTLEAHGMARAFPHALTVSHDILVQKTKLRNQILDAREQLYAENRPEFRKLYEYMHTIQIVGKKVYNNSPKKNEYRIDKLIEGQDPLIS